jgi:hypothetical protein
MLLIPPDDLEVVGLGTVRKGVPVDVPADMAGWAEDPAREPAMIRLRDAIAGINHEDAQALRDQIATMEMGHGLLAAGWLPVAVADAEAAKPKAKTAPKNEE